MNILFLSPFLPYPEDIGFKFRTTIFLQSLKTHKVILLTFKAENELVSEENLKRLCSELYVFNRPIVSKFKKFRNYFSIKPLLAGRFYQKEFETKVKEILSDRNIDLVIVEALYMAEYIRNNKKIFKVLNEHNLEFIRAGRRIGTTKNIFKKLYYYLISLRLKKYELDVIRDFELCVVCSDIDKNILENYLSGKKIAAIPNTVDTGYFNFLENSGGSKRIIYIGTMWYDPNIDAVKYFCRDVLPLLEEELSDIEFIIVGAGPTPEVSALAEKGNISVTGYVEDVRPYLTQSNVFIAPIRVGSGTRLKILAAMSMGIPVVSTSIGCEGLEVNDGIDICIADTPQDFTAKILKIFLDDDFRLLLVNRAKALVDSKYSHETGVKLLLPLWEEIESEITKE